MHLSARDGLLNPGFLQLVAPEGAKELFVSLNAYGPDRHGDLKQIQHSTELKLAAIYVGLEDAS